MKWSFYYLYVILDVFSRYVTGWMIAYRETAGLAKQLIEHLLDAGGLIQTAVGKEGWSSEEAAIARIRQIAGICCNQLYDVEQEVNGLLTYNRKPKFDLGTTRRLNELLV